MNCQTVLPKSFRNDFHDTLSVAVIAEPDHEVIRVADEEGTISKTRFHFVLEPKVQHVVQEHIR